MMALANLLGSMLWKLFDDSGACRVSISKKGEAENFPLCVLSVWLCHDWVCGLQDLVDLRSGPKIVIVLDVDLSDASFCLEAEDDADEDAESKSE
jgi:hypothetical protein